MPAATPQPSGCNPGRRCCATGRGSEAAGRDPAPGGLDVAQVDSSPNQHASAHAAASGHRIVQSFEPGEDWFWDYQAEDYGSGPALAPPVAHPTAQPVPGPAGRVPADWRSRLH